MRNEDRLMPAWRIIAAVTVCSCFTLRLASGQGDAAGRHKQFIASLKRIAADITSRALDDVANLDGWKETRALQYKHFMYTMGLDPMPERTPLRARDQKPSTAEDLACLERLPRDAINYRIDELFLPSVKPVSYNRLEDWSKRKAELLAELSSKTFRWFPKNQIPFDTRVSGNRGGWANRYAEYKDVTIQTEPEVRIRVQLLRALRTRPKITH